MMHEDITIKRRGTRSIEVGKEDLTGHVICQFDGGSAAKMGFGGVLIWGPTGQLWIAKAIWYGESAPTNNAAEIAALTNCMQLLT